MVDKYTLAVLENLNESFNEGRLSEDLYPFLIDLGQPSSEFDSVSASPFDQALDALDNMSLDPNNPSATLAAVQNVSNALGVKSNQVAVRANVRNMFGKIAENISAVVKAASFINPEVDKKQQRTFDALKNIQPITYIINN